MEYFDFYEEIYADTDMSYHNEEERLRFILDNIPDEFCHILDIGCNDGTLASQYRKINNVVYGIDMSSKALDKAALKGIITIHGDFTNKNLMTYSNKFDVIVAGETLEHVFDTDDFMQKICRLLRRDGKFIITTPNVASLGRRLMLLLGMNPMLETDSRHGRAGHIRYYTFKDLRDQLDWNGFRVEKIQSTVVNFSSNKPGSRLLAKMFKTFGASICVVAKHN